MRRFSGGFPPGKPMFQAHTKAPAAKVDPTWNPIK
jgi:hypothetical protein